MALLCNNSFYKHSHALRIVFYVAFMLVLSLPYNAKAQDEVVAQELAIENPYIIDGIDVDITADNAVEAREQAFEAAQIKGYEELAKRMLGVEKFADFETPDIDTISSFVRDYEVTNEKLSAVRYHGVYRIHFSKKAFAETLNPEDGGINNIVQTGDTLVLPFYQRGSRSFLWQANPFMQAWVRARNNNVAGRAIIPVGDIDDITQVRDQQALSYDPSRLNAMRLRYNATQSAILIASPNAQANGINNIQLSLYRAQAYGPELVRQISIRSFAGENEDQFYNRIVMEASKMLGGRPPVTTTQQLPNDNAIVPLDGPDIVITAQLNFSSVREWIDTKRKLENMRGVSALRVQSMGSRVAILNIRFKGGEETLRANLAKEGLALNNPQQGQIFQLMQTAVTPYVSPVPAPVQQQQLDTQSYMGGGY